jgi:hypothetical protein
MRDMSIALIRKDIHVKSNEPCFSFCSYFEAFNSETNSHFFTSGKHLQPSKGLKTAKYGNFKSYGRSDCTWERVAEAEMEK